MIRTESPTESVSRVRRGVAELGLNVFGSNATARHLYESLGFQVTSQQMAKPLVP